MNPILMSEQVLFLFFQYISVKWFSAFATALLIINITQMYLYQIYIMPIYGPI